MKQFAIVAYSLIGAASIGYGLFLVHPAAAAIWGGAYVLVDAWRLGNVQPRK